MAGIARRQSAVLPLICALLLGACSGSDGSKDAGAAANVATDDQADDNLDFALDGDAPTGASESSPESDVFDMMVAQLKADTRPEQIDLTRFKPVDATTLLERPAMLDLMTTDPEYIRQEINGRVRAQIGPQVSEALLRSGRARFLALEGCGPLPSEAFGIAEYGEQLDRARLKIGLEQLGLDDQSLIASFNRHNDDGSNQIRQLNEALLAAYQAGKIREIAVVIDLSEGCGAGEIPVKLVSNPPFSKLRIISEFYFSICEIRSKDPWSPQYCRLGWNDVLAEREMLSGAYRYVATWPDGHQSKGQFKIGAAQLDTAEANESNPVLTLRLRP